MKNLLLAGIVILVLTAPAVLAQESTATGELAVRRFVAPEWGLVARLARVQGDVKVRATIAPSGEVSKTEVLSGPRLLTSHAESAIRQWKFDPTGTEVSIEITVHYVFEKEERDRGVRTIVSAVFPNEVEVRTNPPETSENPNVFPTEPKKKGKD